MALIYSQLRTSGVAVLDGLHELLQQQGAGKHEGHVGQLDGCGGQQHPPVQPEHAVQQVTLQA